MSAQIATRFPEQPVHVYSISRRGDETWLATRSGAYRIKGEAQPQKIPRQNVRVFRIYHFGEETWLATQSGAYRVKGETVSRPILENTSIVSIDRFDDETWLTTGTGAYRIKGDSEPENMLRENISVLHTYRFGKETWLATTRGAYRIRDNTGPESVLGPDIHVHVIYQFGDETWFGTRKGAYCIKGRGKPFRVTEANVDVNSIVRFGDETWVAAAEGAFLIKNAAITREISPLSVSGIYRFDNETWLETNTGAYRVKENMELKPVIDEDMFAHVIERFGDVTWLGTTKNAYRIKGDLKPHRVVSEDISVHSIYRFGDETWLATDKGAYRIQGEANPERILEDKTAINAVYRFGDEIWLATASGAYRIRSDVIISVSAIGADSLWKKWLQVILPGNLWISGQITPTARYERLLDHRDPYSKDFPRQFTFIMEEKQDEFDRAYKAGAFLPARNASLNLTSGRPRLFLAARDQQGFIFKSNPFPLHGWVIPGVWVIPILTGVLWSVVVALTMALAPFSTFCHDLLMNPFVRKYGSFGLVPLALTVFPPIRRHLFRRYFRRIAEDEGFKGHGQEKRRGTKEVQQRYIVPTEDFLPEKFGEKLMDYKPLLLLGRSGIGKTSFFRYLRRCYASNTGGSIPPGNVVPLFVPLALYQGLTPKAMFHAELESYGRLTDEELTDWFLKQGGFLFFFDGLNEADDDTRKQINSFIKQHGKSSYFCLSSQQAYEEYEWIQTANLAPLSVDRIRDLLKENLGEEEALVVISQFTARTYEVYAIPQDLKLATNLIREGKPLPQSKRELYGQVLAPIFQHWVEAGQGDFPELLTKRAYDMLCIHDPFFDEPERPMPADLKDKLITEKLLIKRGDRLLFQHDLVRGYLAARHFVQQWNAIPIHNNENVTARWDALFPDPTVKIDSNWRTMLEFTILEIATPQATESLLLSVLKRNQRLAAMLFKWVKESYPNLVVNWEREFNQTYGKVALE